jgi:hypothetical protein
VTIDDAFDLGHALRGKFFADRFWDAENQAIIFRWPRASRQSGLEVEDRRTVGVLVFALRFHVG